MSINPFTGKSTTPEDPRGIIGGNSKRNFFIVLFVVAIGAIVYVLRDKIADSFQSMDRDFTTAYLMGDPWNGKIVYSDYTRSEPIKQYYRVYDTKTKERKVFAEFKFGTDPNYAFYYVGEDEVILHDYVKYSVEYNLSTNAKTAVKQAAIDYNTNTGANAADDTMAVLPQNGRGNNLGNKTAVKPVKKYYQWTKGNTDMGSGMGINGSEEQEEGLDATALKTMGVYDFNEYGLKYSYWVYDWYAKQEIIDSNTGANLVLIELSKGTNNVTKSFFALVDKKSNKLLVNGYPNNTYKGAGYLHDYFINCRRDGKDHILCLTRDRVLRVQISTCKIEEVATW